jgi:hypothetical protein
MLYKHNPRPHNHANILVKLEQEISSINTKIAVTLTRAVGSMTCAYIFVCLSIAGFPGLHASMPTYVQWVSQTFLQLVFLPVLSVGQQVLSKHQEVMATHQYETVENIYHDADQVVQHLAKQDEELLRQSEMINAILEKLAAQ